MEFVLSRCDHWVEAKTATVVSTVVSPIPRITGKNGGKWELGFQHVGSGSWGLGIHRGNWELGFRQVGIGNWGLGIQVKAWLERQLLWGNTRGNFEELHKHAQHAARANFGAIGVSAAA